MDNNIQRYQLMQEGRKFILTSEIYGNNIRLTCVENDNNNAKFIGEFSLNYLRQLSTLFNSILTIQDAQNLINKTIEEQKLTLQFNNGSINLLFFLNNNENANFTLSNSNKPIEITYSPPEYLPVKKVDFPPAYIKRPTIYENTNEDNINDILQQSSEYIPNLNLNSIGNQKKEIINFQLNQNDNLNLYANINQYNNYPIGSPKREQIEYNNPGSPSKVKLNYSAVPSKKII